jgi:hypothetical protein
MAGLKGNAMPQAPSFRPRDQHTPRVGPVVLPAEGRKGPPPAWPASGRTSKAVLAAWTELWATPQAFAWERLGWTREVARYCRLLVRAEQPGSTAAVHAQATALADRLGLTPKAMRLLLWTTDQPAAPEAPAAAENVSSLEDRRQRLSGA